MIKRGKCLLGGPTVECTKSGQYYCSYRPRGNILRVFLALSVGIFIDYQQIAMPRYPTLRFHLDSSSRHLEISINCIYVHTVHCFAFRIYRDVST